MTSITDITLVQPQASTPRRKIQARQPENDNGPSISSASTLLTNAGEKAMDAPDIDEARVESIREAICNGEMTIDYEKLAQKMLEFELNLFDY